MGDIVSAGGTTTSLSKTPQAGDDWYAFTEDQLTSNSTLYNVINETIFLDVMANDLGGRAKSLFSISDVDGTPIDDLTSTDLLTNSKNSLWEKTTEGNWIRICNGKIEYRLADPLHPGDPTFARDVESLRGNEAINDTFVYAIKLGNGTLSWATVHIGLAGSNDAATISGDTAGEVVEAGGLDNATAGTPTIGGDLNVNDVDSGEAKFQTPVSTAGTYGSFSFDAANGEWSYTLDNASAATQALTAGEVKYETLTVTSLDGTATQVISVKVTGTNDNATILGDTAGTVTEAGGVGNVVLGTPVTGGVLSVSDVDAGQSAFQAPIAASLQGAYGSFTFNADTGVWSYALDNDLAATQALAANAPASDSLTVFSFDGTASETITVQITGTNDWPLITGASDTSAAVSEGDNGDPVSDGGQLVVSDPDAGAAQTYDIETQSAHGTASIDADGYWTFTANDSGLVDQLAAGEALATSFVVRVEDGLGGSDTEVVNVTITGTNDAPELTGAQATLAGGSEDIAYVVTALELLQGFSDVDNGAVLSVADLSADHGTVTDNGDGTFTITPAANYHGPITLSYNVIDGEGGSVAATLGFELASVQDLFVDAAAERATNEDQPVTSQTGAYSFAIGGNGLTSHSIDPLNGPANGSVVIDLGGQYTYTPDANFHGTDSFTVIVYDPAADETLTQVVTVTVASIDDLVVAAAVERSVNEDGLIIASSGAGTTSGGALLHSIDPLGDAQHGTVTIDVGGQYSYTPDANFHGTDSFTILIDDPASDESRSQVVTVTVNSMVDLIASASLSVSGNEDNTINGASDAGTTSGGSLFHSIDPLNGPAHGSVTIDAGGAYAYVPAANFNGNDSFTILIEDPASGESRSQVINVTVNPVNDAAVIGGTLAGPVTEDAATASVSGDASSTDIDGSDDLWIAASGTSAYGSWSVNAAGQWSYTLNNANPTVNALNDGQLLGDSFTIQTADGTPATVAITINGHTDVTALILPPTFTGTGDPNDHDSDFEGSAVNIAGANSAQTLHGGNLGDTINAGGGNDSVYGHGGDDVIRGEGAADTSLFGQAGHDTIAGGQAGDTIFGGSGNDTIYGFEAPAGNIGGDQNDDLYGGSGDDTIYGQGGNDTIIGGYGADTLTGGGASDTFSFLGFRDTNDIITDFDHIADSLDFSQFDADSALVGQQLLTYGGTAATAHGVWHQVVGANTVVYADTDGNLGTAEFMVTINGTPPLDNTDFLFI